MAVSLSPVTGSPTTICICASVPYTVRSPVSREDGSWPTRIAAAAGGTDLCISCVSEIRLQFVCTVSHCLFHYVWLAEL